MAVKKQIFIEAELEWAETKLQEWREYVDAHPFATITHDIEHKPTKGGGLIPMVIASRESKIKCLRDTIKDYFALLPVVDALRFGKEQEKRTQRGGKEIPESMEDSES